MSNQGRLVIEELSRRLVFMNANGSLSNNRTKTGKLTCFKRV